MNSNGVEHTKRVRENIVEKNNTCSVRVYFLQVFLQNLTKTTEINYLNKGLFV